MSLTDIVSHFGLSLFPAIGLCIFFAVFLAVSVRALRTPRQTVKSWAALPLEDGSPVRRTGPEEPKR